MKNLCILFIIGLSLISCRNEIERDLSSNYKHYDYFDKIKPFWEKSETTDSTRYEIVTEKELKNKTLKFYLHPDDFNASGKRNEFKFKLEKEKDKRPDSTVFYTFQFKFSKDFFKARQEKDWLIIHQWHDQPPAGMTWSEYDGPTGPPVDLAIFINPDNEHYIVYNYGIKTKEKNLKKAVRYKEPLQPDTWYTFKNEIVWSYNDDGYSVPQINDTYLVKEENGKLYGANIVNEAGNYYKMGLYGNLKGNDTISIEFDNFGIKSTKKNSQ